MKIPALLPFLVLLVGCSRDPARWIGVWQGDTSDCTLMGLPVTVTIQSAGKEDEALGELFLSTVLGLPTTDYSIACESDGAEVDLGGNMIETHINQACEGYSLPLGYSLSMALNSDDESADGIIGMSFLFECTVDFDKTSDSPR
jgi:hypothetical protein